MTISKGVSEIYDPIIVVIFVVKMSSIQIFPIFIESIQSGLIANEKFVITRIGSKDILAKSYKLEFSCFKIKA